MIHPEQTNFHWLYFRKLFEYYLCIIFPTAFWPRPPPPDTNTKLQTAGARGAALIRRPGAGGKTSYHSNEVKVEIEPGVVGGEQAARVSQPLTTPTRIAISSRTSRGVYWLNWEEPNDGRLYLRTGHEGRSPL